MSRALREFKDALIVRNVVARVKTAKEFSSPEALKEYLSKHPKADKSKHKVVDPDVERIKKDLKPTQDIAKGQAKSEKDKAKRKEEKSKKDESDRTDKLKKDLEDHKKKFPEGAVRKEPKKPEDWKDETDEEADARRKKMKK